MTSAPVTTARRGTALCAIGPAETVRPALDGATLLTIDHGRFTGDEVWLRGPDTWDSQLGRVVAGSSIAEVINHPVHGEVIAAYIDLNRLAAAPRLRAVVGSRYAGVDAAQVRADAMVPSCGNCGNCARCC